MRASNVVRRRTPRGARRRRCRGVRWHSRRASAGRPAASPSSANSTRKSLPSPWCLVSESPVMRGARRPRPAPPRRPGRGRCRHQRTRGSRRNHRSWRTANWRVRSTIDADRGVERDRPVEVVEQLLVAERLTGRARHPRRPRRAPPRRGAPPPSSPRRAARCARPARRAASAARSSTASVGGYAWSPGPYELNGRPLPMRDLEGPLDAPAVGRVDARRRRRVELGEAVPQVGGRQRRRARRGPPATVPASPAGRRPR